jgi:hypothetical protein
MCQGLTIGLDLYMQSYGQSGAYIQDEALGGYHQMNYVQVVLRKNIWSQAANDLPSAFLVEAKRSFLNPIRWTEQPLCLLRFPVLPREHP